MKRVLVLKQSPLLVFEDGIRMMRGTVVELEDAAAKRAIKAGVGRLADQQTVYGHEDDIPAHLRAAYGVEE